jgi:hypothetical protein
VDGVAIGAFVPDFVAGFGKKFCLRVTKSTNEGHCRFSYLVLKGHTVIDMPDGGGIANTGCLTDRECLIVLFRAVNELALRLTGKPLIIAIDTARGSYEICGSNSVVPSMEAAA